MGYKDDGRDKQEVSIGFGRNDNSWTTKGDSIASGEGRLFSVKRVGVKDIVVTASPSGPRSCPKMF
jgi:hypothetical protein